MFRLVVTRAHIQRRSLVRNHRGIQIINSNDIRCLSTSLSLRNGDFDMVQEVLKEPSFYSQGLGLANQTPSGLMQALLENVHLSFDLPWWGTIVSTTIVLRCVISPFVIKTRKIQAKTFNLMPETQKLELKMHSATSPEEARKATKELFDFKRKNGISELSLLGPIFANGAIFTTMFFALRGIANHPVESLKTGGLSWFTDLTMADPMFLLPLITSSSIFANIKVGGDGLNLDQMPDFIRIFLLAMPWLMLPFMSSFPCALNVYWLTTNIFSIFQMRFLRLKSVQDKLGIEEQRGDIKVLSFQEKMQMLVDAKKRQLEKRDKE